MEWLNRLRRRNVIQASSAKDWGNLIYCYVCQLFGSSYDEGKRKKAERETQDRGLAFGQIRVFDGSYGSVKLGLVGEQKLTAEETKAALQKALVEQRLDSIVELTSGFGAGDIKAQIIGDDKTLKGVTWSGIRNGQPTSGREFLTASCWDTGGLREMEAHSVEATCVLVRAAETLGFYAGSIHYTHETPIRIENIVVYAARWEDPQTGCRYLDVLYQPELVKHQVWHGGGRTDRRTEGSFKGEVLACTAGGSRWPRMTINNRPVYSTIIQVPTSAMLNAKNLFAKESVQLCKVCGKSATHEIMLVQFEEGGDFGGSSMGGIEYACHSEVCIGKIRAQKCVRSILRPYRQEVWAA